MSKKKTKTLTPEQQEEIRTILLIGQMPESTPIFAMLVE